jgi:hypothetical protein
MPGVAETSKNATQAAKTQNMIERVCDLVLVEKPETAVLERRTTNCIAYSFWISSVTCEEDELSWVSTFDLSEFRVTGLRLSIHAVTRSCFMQRGQDAISIYSLSGFESRTCTAVGEPISRGAPLASELIALAR